MKNIKEEFLKLYSQWEAYLKSRYGGDNLYKLSKNFWREELSICKKEGISENELLVLVNIRNAYVHSRYLLEINYGYVNVLLRKLINIFCKTAMDIATPSHKIYTARLDTKISKIIQDMHSNLYTHVPIIQNSKFYGVFSENSLLKIVARNKLNSELIIKDVLSIIKNNKGSDEYEFLSDKSTFYDVYELFQKYIDKGKRLGVVFLTKNGKASGNIRGLITAWDLHKGLEAENH